MTSSFFSKNGKKALLFTVKVGLSVVLIIWLINQNRLDFSLFANLNFNTSTVILLCSGAFFVLFGLLLLGWRLCLLLRFKGFSVRYKKFVGITFAGSLLGVVLPGLVGGDAMKAVYLCSNVSERRMDALTSVVIDRFLGLYSLLLLGTLALFGGWLVDFMPFDSRLFLIAPIIVLLIGVGLCLFGWDMFFNARFVQLIFSVFPQIIKNFIVSLREYLSFPSLIIKVITLSIFNHAFVLFSYIIAAVLFNDNIPILSHFVINPLAMVMNAIPITPGGLGMAESIFAFLFQAAGSCNGAMVGLLGRFIQYVVFILSGSIALSLLKMRSHIFTIARSDD